MRLTRSAQPGTRAGRPTPPPSRALRLAASAVSGAALVVVVLLALAMIVVPLALHATPFTVLTGSMEPSLPPGTLVVSRPVDPARIRIGDVVTYQLESNRPAVVTHRVVGIGSGAEGELTFVTRGDSNNVADEPIRAVQVRGVVVYHVPYAGYVNTWVGGNRPGWMMKAVAGGLIGYGLLLVLSAARDRVRAGRSAGAAAAAGTPGQGDDGTRTVAGGCERLP
jgi:signal peptidase